MKSASSLLCCADLRVLLRRLLLEDYFKYGEEHPEGDGCVDDHRDDVRKGLAARSHRTDRPRVNRVLVEDLEGGRSDRDDDVGDRVPEGRLPHRRVGLEGDVALGEEVDDLSDQQRDLDSEEVCEATAPSHRHRTGRVIEEIDGVSMGDTDGQELKGRVNEARVRECRLESRHEDQLQHRDAVGEDEEDDELGGRGVLVFEGVPPALEILHELSFTSVC